MNGKKMTFTNESRIYDFNSEDQDTVLVDDTTNNHKKEQEIRQYEQIVDSLTDIDDYSITEQKNNEDLNRCKGISIEIEFDQEDIELSNVSMIAYTIELITKRKETKMIVGVLGLNKRLLDSNL